MLSPGSFELNTDENRILDLVVGSEKVNPFVALKHVRTPLNVLLRRNF